MCHQSVGLIARDLEAAGIPTLSMTSAWSITEAVRVPRAAFVDYPLGHTVGEPHDPAGQRELLRAALSCFATIERPETIVDLGLEWGDDAWREQPLRGTARTVTPAPAAAGRAAAERSDSRVERHDTPQYQTEADRTAAEARHGEEVACRACVGFDA